MNVLERILEEIKQEHPYKIQGQPDTYSTYNEAWQDCIDRVRYTLNDSYIGTWIPCNERLPEIGCDVLVQWEKYERYSDMTYTYIDKMWLDSIDENGNPIFETIGGIPNGKVIAWQPLPEPYKPKEPKATKNIQQEFEDFWRDK